MFTIAGEIDCQVVNTQKYSILQLLGLRLRMLTRDSAPGCAGGYAPRPHYHPPTMDPPLRRDTELSTEYSKIEAHGHKLNVTNQQH